MLMAGFQLILMSLKNQEENFEAITPRGNDFNFVIV